jgi:ubiquinone/menaquinone biosynthesis C-methylase UbiE
MPDLPPDFEPRRFRSTVPYYARYRLAYPELLIRRVVALVGIERGDPVLDLGCGPGLLAVPFALAGMSVTAVDPEPDMLTAAAAAAEVAGTAVTLRRGSSFDLPQEIGPFRLAAMGRSFHWMDRAETLRALDRLVAPGGAVVLFGDSHPTTAENRWHKILDEFGERYGTGESEHRAARKRPDYRGHASMLFESPFPELETAGIVIRREITADEIVGLAFSRSVTARQKLGDRVATFETDLRRELAALSPDGRFSEVAEIHALVARRPSRAA